MNSSVLVTGGTGFLGTEIVSRLLQTTDDTIYVLVRAESSEHAIQRLRSVWYHSEELLRSIGTQIFPVTGDLTRPDLGLTAEDAPNLQDSVSLVFHCAAEINFQQDEDQLRRINCQGTANAVAFAAGLSGLRRFVHISTAYVAGQKTGKVTEDEPVGTEFSSLYERSKAEAETLVRSSGLPFSICRPGMIVGNSHTGRVKNFNTIYYVLKLLLLGRLPVLPVRRSTRLNLVPVDHVAEDAVKIAFAEDACGRTFHLTCPRPLQPRAGELADYALAWAKENLAADLPRPVFLPMDGLKKFGLAYNRKSEDRRKTFARNLLTLLPYFFSDQDFDRSNTNAVAGLYEPDWKKFIDPLLAFACRHNFMRQDGSTVFEQAKIRRQSRRYPVCYYDVNADGIHPVTGPEANDRIEEIRSALWAWGVRRGDRVALTGINSVDYMLLDQAIGLLGAVSVPIYYTAPADEISLLLSRSGAGWFFVGDARIMARIEEVRTDAGIFAFSEGRAAAGPSVTSWDSFLARAQAPAPVQHPDPDDLATIRYTSGTTGEPKGVMFTFAQLAWMGEVLTDLLPWQDRNRSMRYLSFLPLSHVVEGILASYAPYYMLAKADIYYLNEFSALTQALPRVRPSVFFSVPRFYEKLWAQIMDSDAGRRWKQMKDGPARRAAGHVVRKVALRKAGLSCCRQLITGSAPISEALLRDYRSLGIEIHNAYGQTEAPLITINRLGDNQIPTIGTPLPQTEVTVASDGELLVRGPQVTAGYYGLDTDTVKDGLLRTGDLGSVLENGHVCLQGRKKDMIITAYGKNISIPKIEEKLKDIPCVDEALLIGENRPYCTALIWLAAEAGQSGSKEDQASFLQEEIEEEIRRMNEGLSHPEQVRRFRIISRPLTISGGELTPNLKVKRAVVEEHYSHEIEEMYR